MAKYYIIRKQAFTYNHVAQFPNESEHERGLDELCFHKGTGKHDWLILPVEEGQKEYLMCLKCSVISHF